MTIHFRPLFDRESSSYTYLLWDDKWKHAALIDSVHCHVQRDLKLIRELECSLHYVFETHIHADHVSGAGKLRELAKAVIVYAEHGPACADQCFKQTTYYLLGDALITAIQTPGHTAESACYYLEEQGWLFSGDTLLIRGNGRTDFPSSDPGALYDSITKKLFTLPDSTIVYPAHDYTGQQCTTIGEERQYNPRLTSRTREDFIAIMNAHRPNLPSQYDHALKLNTLCGND